MHGGPFLWPTGNQAIEAYMPSRAKDMGIEVWGFREKEGNSQEDEMSKYLVNKYLLGHTEMIGHRDEF